jgi:hypothetical protein
MNPDGVLTFANKYGRLGVGELIVSPSFGKAPGLPGKLGRPGRLGEPIESWTSEIVTMSRLVRLWDPSGSVRSRSPEKIRQQIRVSDEEIRYEWKIADPTDFEVIASKRSRPELLEHLKPRREITTYVAGISKLP